MEEANSGTAGKQPSGPGVWKLAFHTLVDGERKGNPHPKRMLKEGSLGGGVRM